ncbi:hypothetical protein GQ55_6G258500 [Panicum hallii var. hallii]|uniref:BTB domain-containing protein n=1 Tax=Panicum hallii var. hallii TaxID=1504633 RepID=A0A2T7D9Q5_9POAL|nr:hypothetical protein GQ55_6G258500 [Panicum hallii var. hallii]
MRTTMVDSAAVEFKVDYEQTKHLAAREAVHSDPISAGGHMWRINWYPRGICTSGRMRGVTMMVELMSKSRSAKAIVEASLLIKGEELDLVASKGSFLRVFEIRFHNLGWLCFVDHKDLLKYVIDGQISLLYHHDIGKHLGTLLDSTDGVDVSFIVDGETFHAHRAVLAARFYVPKDWDNVSVDTVGDALACAEIYSCPELKSKCIEFVVADENFKKVVLTESFMQLGQKFPSIIAEVRKRVGA